jgi:outer membrane protein OmpA-like peptidoglycan-associated protein
MTLLRRLLLTAVLALATGAEALAAGAGTQADCADGAGASDHPLLPRYEGACLLASRRTAFDRFQLALGKPVKRDDVWTTEPVQIVEGEITRLMYSAPEGRSALEVLRNYQLGLPERGFEILFQCSGSECGGNDQLLNNVVFERSKRRSLGGDTIYYAFQGSDQQHFLAARKSDGSAYISLYVGTSNFKSSATSQLMGRAIILADVIVPAAMEVKLIDAAQMARTIGATGRVALDNVYFEFGSAVLTPESTPALDEMAKLLRNDPALAVYIVGHTDNVGAYETNLTLSRARAEAVMAALVSRGIAANRMIAAGVASLAPLASNRSEDGRDKNRRVELVEK